MTSGSKGSRRREKIDVQAVDLEPTRRGYQLTYNYAIRFWLPILGPFCFALWQALISFCFGDRDKCWPSISLLADMAAGGNRKIITGRWRTQGDSRLRQSGALEHLEAHGLLTVETKNGGPSARYVFHVIKEPPLLTPQQLATLPNRLQEMHADLLLRCGMDEPTYRDLSTSPQTGRAHGPGGEARGHQGWGPGPRGWGQGHHEALQRKQDIRRNLERNKKGAGARNEPPQLRPLRQGHPSIGVRPEPGHPDHPDA